MPGCVKYWLVLANLSPLAIWPATQGTTIQTPACKGMLLHKIQPAQHARQVAMHSKDKYTAHAVPPERIQVIQSQLCARNVLLASIQVLLAQSLLPIARTALLASIPLLAQPVRPIARIVLLASIPVLAQPIARAALLASIQLLLAQPVLTIARTVMLASFPVLAQPAARTVLLASFPVLAQPIARTVLLASIQVLPAQPVLPIARTVMLASFPVLAQPAARTVLLASFSVLAQPSARTVLLASRSGQAARPVLLARSQFLTVRPGQKMTGVIIQIQHWQHNMQHWRQVQRRFPPTWTVFQLSGRNMRTKTAGVGKAQ